LWEIVKDRTDDQSHHRVSEKLREGQSWISFQPPKASPKTELHLSDVRQRVRTADSLMLRLLDTAGVFEFLKMFASKRVGLIVLINLLHECSTLRTVLPNFGEVIRCSWYSVFPAIPYNTFLRTRHRSEEICGSLSFRAVETKVNKVLLCLRASTEVYLTSFVQDENLVENLRVLAIESDIENGERTSYAL
jgi:hypothetical protein